MIHPARSIFAIDASPFGRSLALLPAMRSLRASYSKALLVVSASTGTSELLAASGLIDEIVDLGLIKTSGGPFTNSLKRLAVLMRSARRFNCELVLDFSPRLETQIASRIFIRARTIVPSRLPLAIEILRSVAAVSGVPDSSPASDYASVLQQAGVEMNESQFVLAPDIEENARFEQRLAKSGSRGGELIVLLYASNTHDLSGWPANAFAEVAVRLANNLGARVIAADEPADDSFTNATMTMLPAGTIKLVRPRALELLAAIARASIVITDEPGVAQAASDLGTPVVEIGSTASASARSRSHRIIEGSSRKRISTDEVYEAACELIQDSRSPSLFYRP
jgi:ADP-heptose:LPS heptosyltransferase